MVRIGVNDRIFLCFRMSPCGSTLMENTLKLCLPKSLFSGIDFSFTMSQICLRQPVQRAADVFSATRHLIYSV